MESIECRFLNQTLRPDLISVCVLKATHPGLLKVSGLQEGIYTFQMTVTDMAGQKSSDNVSVTVLAPKHRAEGEDLPATDFFVPTSFIPPLRCKMLLRVFHVDWLCTWEGGFVVSHVCVCSVYWPLLQLPVQVWWWLLHRHHLCLRWEAALSGPLWRRLLHKL